MGVFNLDSEEFKHLKEITQSLAQVTCPGHRVEQGEEGVLNVKASGLPLPFIRRSFAIPCCMQRSIWRKKKKDFLIVFNLAILGVPGWLSQ